MIEPRWSEARRVLAVRLDNLGDVLVTTPALHAIKSSLPQASLTLLASAVGAQVGRLNRDVDDVLVYAAPWMDPWHQLPQDSGREQEMIALLRERRFDGAIIFTSFRQSALPAAYLCYLADIPLRVAASIDGPGSLLTTRHKHPERMMHEVERGLDLVGALGLTSDELDLVLDVPDEGRKYVHNLLLTHQIYNENNEKLSHTSIQGQSVPLNSAKGPLVVVHVGCSMPARTYPWEMYVEVVNLLVEELGATVLLTGTEDERELVERILESVEEKTRSAVFGLAGELPFAGLCALIEAADVMITNNTGPMHIAAAVKTLVVALFALTNPPEQWGPWRVPHRLLNVDVPCRICYSRVCPYGHECLRLVSPQVVVKATKELLEEAARVRAGMRATTSVYLFSRQGPPTTATNGGQDSCQQLEVNDNTVDVAGKGVE